MQEPKFDHQSRMIEAEADKHPSPPLRDEHSDLTNEDVKFVADLLRNRIPQIQNCISKGQLRRACNQLLAQNVAYQTQIVRLNQKIQGLVDEIRHLNELKEVEKDDGK